MRASTQATDEELVQRIVQQKDTALFSLLYDRYAQKVFARCRGFTKDNQAAEDLAHDVLIKVYLKLKDFEGKARFSTWLYSITYHFCVDYSRKVGKPYENYEDHLEDIPDSDHSDAELMQIRVEKLKVLLEKISSEDKALLLMKYQEELSIGEIMQITLLKESTVKMRLKRAKEKIVKMTRGLT